MPVSEARISPMDRGFLFSDGVYEVITVCAGRIRAFSLHCQRLKNSLDGIHLMVDATEIMEQARRLLSASGLLDAKIYIQVTRGKVDVREHRFPNSVSPTVFLTICKFSHAQLEPCKAIVRPDIRWSLASIKSVSLLGNVLLQEEAYQAGASEAILHRNGKVTEASTSNVFGIHDDALITPKLSSFILPGITRHLVIQEARKLGLTVFEQDIPVEQLVDFETLFVTSSTRGLLQIVELMPGGHIGDGKLSEVFIQMTKAYERVLGKHD